MKGRTALYTGARRKGHSHVMWQNVWQACKPGLHEGNSMPITGTGMENGTVVGRVALGTHQMVLGRVLISSRTKEPSTKFRLHPMIYCPIQTFRNIPHQACPALVAHCHLPPLTSEPENLALIRKNLTDVRLYLLLSTLC